MSHLFCMTLLEVTTDNHVYGRELLGPDLWGDFLSSYYINTYISLMTIIPSYMILLDAAYVEYRPSSDFVIGLIWMSDSCEILLWQSVQNEELPTSFAFAHLVHALLHLTWKL